MASNCCYDIMIVKFDNHIQKPVHVTADVRDPAASDVMGKVAKPYRGKI